MSTKIDPDKLRDELFKLKSEHDVLRKDYEELKDKYNQLLGMTNNLPGCVIFQVETRGQDTRFSYMGDNALEHLGYTAQMALDNIMVPYGRLSENDFNQFMLRANEARANEGVLDWTGCQTRKDGRSQKLRIRSKYRYVSDEVFVFDGIIEDMNYSPVDMSLNTEKAEESIAKRLMTGVEQANDGVLMTDSEGSIYYVNPAFTEITGYSLQELTMKTPRVLKSGEHSDSFYDSLWTTISTGKVWSGRFVNRRKDSSVYLDETTITPVFNPKGEIRNYIAIKRDVTREVELEKQLIKSQRVEAIGTLAGGIAHDFNNILTAMLAFCVRAQERKPDDSVVNHCLSKIKMATSRAANLVDQILTFSRSRECEKNLVSLSLPVEECVRLLRASFPRNINLKFESENDAMVLADETHIHQIVMNLCTNACHSMDKKGGILTIKISLVDIPNDESVYPIELDDGAYARLIVSDTGCGISPDKQQHIFAPYYTTKKMGDGTGIGLSLVQKLVSEYDGSITVDSVEGKGSSFTVYLPQASGIVAEQDQIHLSASSLRGREHILLVDDETAIIEVLRPSLEELGYKVTSCFNAEEAHKIFESDPESFDILVTDQILTGTIGSELAEKLLSIKPSLPVIICSGFSNIINEKTSLELGFNAFMKKPFDSFDLARSIRNIAKIDKN